MDEDGAAMLPEMKCKLQLVRVSVRKRSFVSISPPVPVDQVYGCKDKCNRHIFGALPLHKKEETKPKMDIF